MCPNAWWRDCLPRPVAVVSTLLFGLRLLGSGDGRLKVKLICVSTTVAAPNQMLNDEAFDVSDLSWADIDEFAVWSAELANAIGPCGILKRRFECHQDVGCGHVSSALPDVRLNGFADRSRAAVQFKNLPANTRLMKEFDQRFSHVLSSDVTVELRRPE